jgi:NAD(P)-dependent dehydrogenase (short-subunit alcohol dehydrogenase family)
VITGGGSGIGRAISEAFAGAGAAVAIFDLDETAAGETVAAIATAYASAGVEHFWDRASLKSGEEWHPRLRREIDRADLFHVCWSKNAAESEWVKKETEHAITRRRRNSGKPDITVQMLDGPPWAKHPPELDSFNFDDFVRAAIVGYARGTA